MNSKIKLLAALILPAVVYTAYAITAEGVLDSGDGIKHYQIARFSWNHPELLLDHWGKPLFTLLSSPFAQFGFKGVMVFNIILGLLAAYFTFKSARKLNLPYPKTAIIFVCFAPVYFHTVLGGLTEVLFSFMLALCIWLCLQSRFVFAAVVLSFMPFSRAEAWLVMPFFGLYFVLKKEYKIIPLMTVGFLLYSFIGWFHYDDFLWVINENPYAKAHGAYGSGELFYFFKSYKSILGNPLLFVFLTGCVVMCYLIFVKKENAWINEQLLLIAAPAFAVLLAHSYFWWMGLYGSFGLTRVIGMVIPCFILLGMYGLYVLKWLPLKKKWLEYALLLAIVWLVVRFAFDVKRFPFRLNLKQQLLAETAEWFKTTEFTNERIYYLHPFLGYLLDVDPFDPEKSTLVWSMDKQNPETNVPSNAIVFWDAIFCPLEGKLPLNALMESNSYELLKSFKPEHEIRFYDTLKFEVYVFRRKAVDEIVQ